MEKEELKKKLNDLITKFIDENAYTQGEDHIQTQCYANSAVIRVRTA
jgi:hypothetical protein